MKSMGVYGVAGAGTRIPAAGQQLLRLGTAVLMAAVMLAAMGGLRVELAAAGEAGTINTDGAGLMAGYEDETVIEWMDAGVRVDVLWGPDNGKYEIRYYDIHGWVWAEYLTPEGVGGTGGTATVAAPEAAPDVTEEPEHWIDVNRSSGTVTLFIGEEPQSTFWASMGFEDTSYGFYATAVGTYHVTWMNPDLQYTPYAENYITDWVGFDSERANGFHSYTKDANGDIVPNGGGKTAGCVALAPGDIDTLFAFAYPGMRVEVHW
ncbi:MAG TPA: L,D-transpeptidase [Thermomicrobiales bacterium]|nr:L,D-transpeptidase [Thermomicrobiales bacterium]